MRILRPRTRLGRATLWLGALSVLLAALRWITRSAPGSGLSGWGTFVTLVFTFCAALLVFRWARPILMWRLRNRLLVTYVFIGVIPILLLLLMAAVGAYVLASQFGTYIVLSHLQSELRHLASANNTLATGFYARQRSGKLDLPIAAELAAASSGSFPQRTVTVWRGDTAFTLPAGAALPNARPAQPPDSIGGNFSGFVIDRDTLRLCALKRFDGGASPLTVISSVPIAAELLQPATSLLGSVTLFPPDRNGNLQMPPPATPNPAARPPLHTGRTPPSSGRFDPQFQFFTLFDALDWATGKSHTAGIGVVTRPSLLANALFAALGDNIQFLQYGLLAIAVFFGLIELAALFIGIRLSRGMTLAIAELYRATVYVERGNLTHRIRVRGRDQMSALELSFNSMTESLSNLIAGQREKQRLESELAIGHEVQSSLFPQNFTGLASLEVFGVCRPARSVSGDYYDFVPLGAGRLVLALGDVSGKGISAALLMAMVHAFVRAYSLEPHLAPPPGAFSAGDPGMYYRGDGSTQSRLAPGTLMTTLNYQFFRSTPPEKYATMFLGSYDDAARRLTYCNAGHLPPFILTAGGEVSRLETSGTVVGLFDGATYHESTVPLLPGDIFVAFSDGVTEPENQSVEFGEERLIELVRENRHQPLSLIGDAITGAVAAWIGALEQPDDITIVLARAR